MDIGTGIPVAVGIITVAISGFKLASIRLGGKPAQSNKCPLHRGVQESLQEGNNRMDKICVDIAVVREVILELAVAQGIPVDKYKKLVK